uniref:Uncharacterized protein n=1 Tax=viral metagenome TaxID=1070528 RepID=A0A6C0I844_9ZZZZ
MFTRKRHASPISGDIEMREIPLKKRLGKKSKSINRSLSSVSSNNEISPERRTTKRLAPNRGIYRQRVKQSPCRRVKKTQCLKKRTCKYTNGSSRKYCRKRRNQQV